ncbi:MAG: esterase YqiA [Gammaproteobacteria bacterium]|nr:esterase YqiA [Gammaproteobacteria bacterium]
MNKIVYLHGFNSSPESYKAKLLLAHMQRCGLRDYIEVPEIPAQPAKAIELLQQRVEAINRNTQVSLVGSSLGGFYATWLAEKYYCPAVLINPAVKPHALLRHYLGVNTNLYTAERWLLDESHIKEFRALYVDQITHTQRYLVLLQTGDQTLDYSEAKEKYAGCPCIIEQGGSHEFDGFERYLDKILSFCNVKPINKLFLT